MSTGTVRDADVARETIRASEGERMWVRINHVKADKRELFEHYIHDILRPAVEKVEPSMFRQVRFLHPTGQNEDGTYTYIFLMDPLIDELDYDITTLLQRAYGEEQAQEYDKMWDEAMDSPQSGYALTQSSW